MAATYADFVDLFTSDPAPTVVETQTALDDATRLELFGPRPLPRSLPGETTFAGRARVVAYDTKVGRFVGLAQLPTSLETKLSDLSDQYEFGEFLSWKSADRGTRITFTELAGRPSIGAAFARIAGSQLIVMTVLKQAIQKGHPFDPEVVMAMRLPKRLVDKNADNQDKLSALLTDATE